MINMIILFYKKLIIYSQKITIYSKILKEIILIVEVWYNKIKKTIELYLKKNI